MLYQVQYCTKILNITFHRTLARNPKRAEAQRTHDHLHHRSFIIGYRGFPLVCFFVFLFHIPTTVRLRIEIQSMTPKIDRRDSLKDNNETMAGERTQLLATGSDDASTATDSKYESKNLVGTTAALAFAMMVQSYLLVSVFPYSGFMAMFLIPGVNEETAGSYAGLIASSFMFGRTFSSFEWGKAADMYGRVFVIRSSLLLSAVFSILFGLAPTFNTALFWRFVLGFCNGLIGPLKTLVSEITDGDQKAETRMMAVVLGMWGYGFLINPAIAGYLSDPVKQYPDAKVVEMLEPILRSSPFLLPNVVGCVFCLIAFFLVGHFVEETLPAEKVQAFSLYGFLSSRCGHCCRPQHPVETPEKNIDFNETQTLLPKWISKSPSTLSLVNSQISQSSHGNLQDEVTTAEMVPRDEEEEEEAATILSLWSQKPTRQHLIFYWMYSFLVISIDEIFPLYCISKTSGLGIQEKVIGNILTGTGLFYVAIQYFLLTSLVDYFGLYKALRIGAFMSIPLCCLVPLSLLTNKGALEGQLTWTSFTFLSMTYAVIRAMSTVTFSTATMLLNKLVPSHHRATMNGLSMLGGSLSKAAGPAFAGLLFSSSVGHFIPPFGSVFAYSIISTMGLCLSIRSLFLKAPEIEK
jgi:MFS family permease